MPHHRLFAVVLAALAFPVAAPVARAESTRLVSGSDAYVSRQPEDDEWEIGNSGIAARFGFDRERNFVLLAVAFPSADPGWTTAPGPDSFLTIGGLREAVGAHAWQFDGAEASNHGGGVELTFRFHSAQAGARAARHYACYPGAPVIEAWTAIEPIDTARPVKVSNLNAFELPLRAGPVHWVTGLETADGDPGPFTFKSAEPGDGQRISFGSTGRATETALPWFMIGVGGQEFFGGLLWPGAWQLDLLRDGDQIRAVLGLPSIETTASRALETPHAYFGIAGGGSIRQASEATRSFVAAALRGDRPFTPLVTYNTWFAYATAINQDNMLAEIESAASLGVELFVLDAGWYRGGTDVTDFTSGLGLWEADRRRFPSGLRALSDRAHDLGIRFGVWVEPERVDIGTVDRNGLARERWLAMADGRYDPTTPNSKVRAAQICLADAEARAWVIDRLTAFVNDVHPDYLKWDNNFWVNCNRAGHGHGPVDGNFAHHLGLRDVLATLRARFPDLAIENCSGGGNRLEPGMLAYSDTAWMDDRTEPAARVRHNFEGLSVVIPPASLLSFVVGGEWGSGDDEDISLSFRSRMPGILGLTWRSDRLDEDAASRIRREIDIYKSVRDVLTDSSARLLSAQVQPSPGPEWDVIQEISAETGDVVVFAFENPGSDAPLRVYPIDLRPDGVYLVSSVDDGEVGYVAGADLMRDGIEVNSSSVTRAHVLRLTLVR